MRGRIWNRRELSLQPFFHFTFISIIILFNWCGLTVYLQYSCSDSHLNKKTNSISFDFTSADIMAPFGVKWLKRPIIMPNRSLIPHFNHLPPYTYHQKICQVRPGSRSSRPPSNRSKILTLKCVFSNKLDQ